MEIWQEWNTAVWQAVHSCVRMEKGAPEGCALLQRYEAIREDDS